MQETLAVTWTVARKARTILVLVALALAVDLHLPQTLWLAVKETQWPRFWAANNAAPRSALPDPAIRLNQ